MWYAVGVVAVVVAVATYLTWVATRVDRLHARAAAARAALDAQSLRRAAAAVEFGESRHLPEPQQAARAVLAAHAEAVREDLPARVEAENRLTKVLHHATEELNTETLTDVVESSRRLALARQVHSDRVRDARAMRRRRLVRLLGLARKHGAPEFFDIEDPALEAGR